MAILREAREEAGFLDKASIIFGSPQRADAVVQHGIVWILARHDDIDGDFTRIALVGGIEDLYAIKTRKTPAFPSVVVYFTIELSQDEMIILWDIIESEEYYE